MSDTPANRLSTMQAAYVVARRDFTAILFSKAFLLFLIGPLFFIAISIGAGMIGASTADSVAPPRMAVALAQDEARAFRTARDDLAELVRMPEIQVVEGRGTDDLLADKNANFGAVLTGTLAAPELAGTQDQLQRWQGNVALIAANATQTDGGAARGFPEVALAPLKTSVAKARFANNMTAKAALTLLFLLTMLLAGMVLSNLVEEKANKIIEVLAAAIPMDAVFFGKLFAMLAISFVGITVWGSVIGLLVATGVVPLQDYPAPAIGWPLFVALFLIYFAMAYLLIGSIFLAVGSMAPTVRDVQTLSMPATILQLCVFFLTTYAMTKPGSAVELFAVIFPLSSPFAMVARGAQDPALWTHAAALAWQVVAVGLFVKAGATLFRRKVMHSGPAKVKAKRKPFWKRAARETAAVAGDSATLGQ